MCQIDRNSSLHCVIGIAPDIAKMEHEQIREEIEKIIPAYQKVKGVYKDAAVLTLLRQTQAAGSNEKS